MRNLMLIILFGVTVFMPAADVSAQDPDLPSIVREAQHFVRPRIAAVRQPLNCEPIMSDKASGWKAQDKQLRTVHFRLQPAQCAGVPQLVAGTNVPSVYILNWMTEGVDNPRNPHKALLYASDFRELLPKNARLQKSLFGDLFDFLKGAADYIKNVVKELKNVIKDYNAIKDEVENILQDAGELTAALLGKAKSAQEVAPMIAQAARLKKQGGQMPHQIYGGALAAGMKENRAFTNTFIEVVSGLRR